MLIIHNRKHVMGLMAVCYSSALCLTSIAAEPTVAQRLAEMHSTGAPDVLIDELSDTRRVTDSDVGRESVDVWRELQRTEVSEHYQASDFARYYLRIHPRASTKALQDRIDRAVKEMQAKGKESWSGDAGSRVCLYIGMVMSLYEHQVSQGGWQLDVDVVATFDMYKDGRRVAQREIAIGRLTGTDRIAQQFSHGGRVVLTAENVLDFSRAVTEFLCDEK
jgi:hypothetical protein